jgi:hypothetical protein
MEQLYSSAFAAVREMPDLVAWLMSNGSFLRAAVIPQDDESYPWVTIVG